MEDLIPSEVWKSFYIWFDFDNRREYYATPLYLHNVMRKDLDANNIELKLLGDVSKMKLTKEAVHLHPSTISIHYAENAGMFLVRLLNADFSTFESSYNTFFYAYGYELVKPYCSNDLERHYKNEKEFVNEVTEYTGHIKDRVMEIQESMKQCVDFVYNINENQPEEFTNYSYRIKLIAYLTKNTDIIGYISRLKTIPANYNQLYYEYKSEEYGRLMQEIQENNNNFTPKELYNADTFGPIAYAVLNELSKYEHLPIKKCQNCGRYFVPTFRQTEIYCDLENINGSSTCREKGASVTYKKNLENVPALALYRKMYQKKVMAVYRNPDDTKQKKEFEKWKKEAQEKIRKFKNEKITEEELNEWMEKNN